MSVSLTRDAAGPDVTVADTGKGMSPDEQARLFQPFYTTKPRGEGAGLGLTFAKTVVEDHGGRIGVAMEPGKGSTFTLRLPLEAPAA